MKILRSVLLLFLVTFSVSAEERWFTFSIGDAKVGHVHEVSRADGSAIVTDARLVAKLERLGSSFEMRFATTTRESAAGDLIALTFESMLSKQTSRVDARVE